MRINHPRDWKKPTQLFGGILIGVVLVVGMGQTSFRSDAIEDRNMARRQTGKGIVGDQTLLAPDTARIEDLPRLVNTRESENRRYELHPVGPGSQEFLVIDTRTGLVRRYGEDNVTLYSATVPNHAIRTAITVHPAF